MSFAGGSAASTLLRDHDSRLDLSIEHLSKAELLLSISSSGELSDKNQKEFDKQLGRAIEAVGDAITAANATIQAAEGGH